MKTVHDRYVSGGNIGNHLRDEERVELGFFPKMLSEIGHLVFKCFDTADAYAVNYANAVAVFALQVESAVFHSLHGSDDGELCIAVHLSCFFAVDIVGYVQTFYLAGELCFEFGCIECRNRGGTTLTGN